MPLRGMLSSPLARLGRLALLVLVAAPLPSSAAAQEDSSRAALGEMKQPAAVSEKGGRTDAGAARTEPDDAAEEQRISEEEFQELTEEAVLEEEPLPEEPIPPGKQPRPGAEEAEQALEPTARTIR